MRLYTLLKFLFLPFLLVGFAQGALTRRYLRNGEDVQIEEVHHESNNNNNNMVEESQEEGHRRLCSPERRRKGLCGSESEDDGQQQQQQNQNQGQQTQQQLPQLPPDPRLQQQRPQLPPDPRLQQQQQGYPQLPPDPRLQYQQQQQRGYPNQNYNQGYPNQNYYNQQQRGYPQNQNYNYNRGGYHIVDGGSNDGLPQIPQGNQLNQQQQRRYPTNQNYNNRNNGPYQIPPNPQDQYRLRNQRNQNYNGNGNNNGGYNNPNLPPAPWDMKKKLLKKRNSEFSSYDSNMYRLPSLGSEDSLNDFGNLQLPQENTRPMMKKFPLRDSDESNRIRLPNQNMRPMRQPSLDSDDDPNAYAPKKNNPAAKRFTPLKALKSAKNGPAWMQKEIEEENKKNVGIAVRQSAQKQIAQAKPFIKNHVKDALNKLVKQGSLLDVNQVMVGYGSRLDGMDPNSPAWAKMWSDDNNDMFYKGPMSQKEFNAKYVDYTQAEVKNNPNGYKHNLQDQIDYRNGDSMDSLYGGPNVNGNVAGPNEPDLPPGSFGNGGNVAGPNEPDLPPGSFGNNGNVAGPNEPDLPAGTFDNVPRLGSLGSNNGGNSNSLGSSQGYNDEDELNKAFGRSADGDQVADRYVNELFNVGSQDSIESFNTNP